MISCIPFSVFANLPSQTMQQFDQLVSSAPSLTGGIVGVSVRDTSTGNIVYEHNGSTRLRPASNLKLVTAASALKVLGKDYTFNTELLTDGSINKEIIKGNLYFKGKGDPTLQVSDLEKMIQHLKDIGITQIEGNLYGDDSWYDGVRLSIDLPWSDESTYYGAQVSAITLSPNEDYDAGTVIVEVRPALNTGEPPNVSITPSTSYVTIENKAVTGKEKDQKTLEISRKHGGNTILIEGLIPEKGVRVKEWVSVWEPTQFVLHQFRKLLNEHGIVVKGEVGVSETPKNAEVFYTHSSMPLSELLIPFLKFSNNGHGEVLVKEMGRVMKGEGSWDKGLEVVNEQLSNWGLDPSTMLLRDGSGISHVNLISANDLSRLLHVIQNEVWYDEYLHALPLAGTSDRLLAGTLLHRMNNIPAATMVRAKTGTLTSVSSLSGYVHTQDGKGYIFSILLNNIVDEEKGKQLEDQLIEILAN